MATQTLTHYELLEKIAEGGMGVVYKARDQRLDRLVALKFLSPQLRASQQEVERFLHEARAISRLNHPNIATIYEVDKAGEAHFLAFEYLPGGTLKQKVLSAHSNGAAPTPQQIVEDALQVAKALAHAHRHGIVHRDVKSENALLSEEGAIKLTDFGVALMGQESRAGRLETAGTAPYMSPEQAQGLEVDHRSDIFSFGVVLFELAVGTLPFPDKREAVVFYDIINTPAPPLSRFRQDLPPSLQAIVARALQKKPADRYPSMDEVVADLKSLGAELHLAVTKRFQVETLQPTIAVLPFVDMSPDKDQDYFCDGITEEIINALTSVKGLKVVSRTSTFQFKGQAYDIREIGEKLGVQTVLEGSVRKAGNQLRITSQHINVADGYHLWSERFDREMADVFAVQDEISKAIVETLRHHLAAEEPRQLVKPPTANLTAYNCYLQGRYYLNQRTRQALEASQECFRQAAREDPQYGLAFAGLAEACTLLAAGGYVKDPAGTLSKACEAARKAIQLDETRAEAHVSLALVYYRADWDWPRCEQEFRRAIELNDGYASAHHHYAMFLAAMNRIDEALAEIRRAHELDPLSLIISTAVGRILYFARRTDEAIEQCQRTVALDPGFANAYFDLAVIYGRNGLYSEALATVEKLESLLPDPFRTAVLRARIYGEMGERDKALDYFAQVNEFSRNRRVSPVVQAIAHVGLRNLDRAMELLEEAYTQRDSLLVYLQCEPIWDPIREHPRYPDLLRKIGFPGSNRLQKAGPG